REPEPVREPASAAPSQPFCPAAPPSSAADARVHLKTMERQMILDALERNQNNKAAVARDLGIPLSTLKRRLKEYRIGEDE
ncbi:MAG: helix-turn-helix domain-containing protein, partial [Candidatus Competibacteraceae bacterium]